MKKRLYQALLGLVLSASVAAGGFFAAVPQTAYGKRQIMRQSLNSTPPVMGGAASGIRPEDYLTMA